LIAGNGISVSAATGDVTVSASGTMPLNNGTAAAPSLYFSGDTNTGIFQLTADSLQITAGGATALSVASTGVTIASSQPFTVSGGTFRLSTGNAPASAGATGGAGQIGWDTDYIYVCTATNTWKRAALSTW
jgi:hypothetical protein